jgi:hypothetical protein
MLGTNSIHLFLLSYCVCGCGQNKYIDEVEVEEALGKIVKKTPASFGL